jgi:uncharacterized membrane protein YphA (DoxX/SURF4 family)
VSSGSGFPTLAVPNPRHRWQNALSLFLRIFIGGIIFASSVGKVLDLPGFAEVLRAYRVFPGAMLGVIAAEVAALEFVLSIWMLMGWHLQTSALVAAGLNAGYAIWMTISLVRGLELSNCGCFGVFFPQPLRWYSPIEDLILVTLCYVLYRLTRSKS